MPSPFPGMDPYLEQPGLWPQCHLALIYNIHAQLNSRLPARCDASMEMRTGNRYVTIRDAASKEVVTAIEILSPTNKKPGDDRDAYLNKRDDYFLAHVNLVEIDLLRTGVRPPLGEHAPSPFAYYVLVSRHPQFPKVGFWPIGMRDELPNIPVPLKPGDPDCKLDLRACLDRGYTEGRWDGKANYAQPPDPPLSEPDATWARDLLEKSQLISSKGDSP